MKFKSCDIQSMESRYRAQFINSLSGFKSASLVGTHNKKGNDNLAIISSIFHVGANPPLLGMILRPHSVRRDTLENIQQMGSYTINHVNSQIIKQAHQTSARFDADISEFAETGLTPFFSDSMAAPYVMESNVKLGMQLESIQNLEINNTELLIGRIVEVIIEENAIRDDGYVDIESLDTATISGLDSYHSTRRIDRFEYAKVGKPVKSI